MTHRLSLSLLVSLSALMGVLVLLLPGFVFAADSNPVAFINTTAQKVVWTLIVNLTGMLLGVGGAILDASIANFVIGFGDTFLKSGVGVAVNQTWVIIRDFVNLGFIFGLVYIGFKMILGNDTSNTRRWLVNLIIAALLVNFSLLMTKVVVDFSNELSAQIAVGALGATEGSDGRYTSKTTSQIMDVMGLTKIFGFGETPKAVTGDGGWGYIIGTGILFMVTAFVFGAGGILLIIRFLALNLYMMLSPLMFVGWVMPFLSDQMSKYWKGFLKRAFFAPIYLLFIYFGMQVLSGLRQSVEGFGNSDYSAALSGGSSGGLTPALTAGTTISFFLLACGFMIAALVIADRMGADGADKAIKIGRDLTNRVRRATSKTAVGTAKFAASQTAGRAARYASDKTGQAVNRNLRRLQQIDPGNNAILKATRAAARSNAFQETVGGAAASLQKNKFGLKRTRSEDAKMQNQTNKQADNAMKVTAGLKAQEEKERVPEGMASVLRNGTLTQVPVNQLTPQEKAVYDQEVKAREDKIAEMQRLVADMGIKDFEAMADKQQVAVAQFLSGSLSESVMKSDNISDKQKGEIEKAQQEAIKKMLIVNNEILSEKLSDLSTRQLELMGDEFINQNAALFTDSQFSDIKKSKKFTEAQIGRFIGSRKASLISKVTPGSPDFKPEDVFKLKGVKVDPATGQRTIEYTKSRKVADIAKLPGEVLEQAESIPYLTVDVLKAIANGDKDFERVSTVQREQIKNNLSLNLLRGGPLAPQMQKALDYLNSPKGQQDFLG